MRVAHIASGDTWGGAERVVALLTEGIGAQPGFSVEALLFNEGRLAEVLRQRGMSVTIIPESRHSFWGLVLALRRWLKTRDPDVVHAHRYKEILAVALALAPRRRGFIGTVHGLEPNAQLPRSRILLIWGALIVGCLAGAKLVAVSSELTARLKRRLGGERIVHIPNPIPPLGEGASLRNLRSHLGWNASRPLVGFVGRLEHVKGPDIFVEIAARCQIDAGFVLIGGGGLADELTARIEAIELRHRIALLGAVPDATPYMKQLDILALSSRHEGLPLVLLEAAASGVPIVAFDVGGVREVLGAGTLSARLVPSGDLAAFQEAIEEFLRNRERCRRDAAELAATVRDRFGLTTISSAYCDLYRSSRP